MRPPPLLVLLAVLAWPVPSAAQDGGPLILSAGFELDAANLCPRVIAERETSGHGSLSLFGLGGGYSSYTRWERLECRSSESALREAVLAGIAKEGVRSLPAERERKLLDLPWVKGERAARKGELRAAARSVGADLILTGSLHDAGTQLMLSLQVIDVASNVLTGATSTTFSRPESLPDQVRASVAEVLGQARKAVPLLWLHPSAIASGLGRLEEKLRRLDQVPVRGRVEEIVPSGDLALVRLEDDLEDPPPDVRRAGDVVGRLKSFKGNEALVRFSGGAIHTGDVLEFPRRPRPLAWTWKHDELLTLVEGGGEVVEEWIEARPADGVAVTLSIQPIDGGLLLRAEGRQTGGRPLPPAEVLVTP